MILLVQIPTLRQLIRFFIFTLLICAHRTILGENEFEMHDHVGSQLKKVQVNAKPFDDTII